MKRTILAFVLFLIPFSANAGCDTLVELYEIVMDLRLEGHAINSAVQIGYDSFDRDNMPEKTYDLWTDIVVSVYDLDPNALTGAGRADTLTALFYGCNS